MALKIIENDIASREIEVDLARFEYDEDSLLLEFAKIITPIDESDNGGEIEVRARLRIPIENALPTWFRLAFSLVDYEQEFNNGYGIPLSDENEEDYDENEPH